MYKFKTSGVSNKKKPMQNSKSARDTIATIQIKTPRKCANTQKHKCH